MRIAMPKRVVIPISLPVTRGKAGKSGINGINGLKGSDGLNGSDGRQGVNGVDGKMGQTGLSGLNGRDGLNGLDGQQGLIPAHRWKGESLQFQNPDGTWGKLIDLRGNQGASGRNFVGGNAASEGADVDAVIAELIAQGYIDVNYAKEIDFESNGDITYIGEATPGSVTSASSWRIKKITVVNTEGDTTVSWADGNTDFDNVWDNHLSLSYS